MKSLKAVFSFLLIALMTLGTARAGQVTGTFATPGGSFIQNATVTFTLSQLAVKTDASQTVAPSTVSCYTSVDGSLVGLPNPQASPVLAATSGSMTAGTYYEVITYWNASGETLASPEQTVVLSSSQGIQTSSPGLQPAGASGYKIYVGIAPGGEVLQATVTGFATTSIGSLIGGSSPPVSNSTPCNIAFNDTFIPAYTTYRVSALDSTGSPLPGFPQSFYLQGSTVNLNTMLPASGLSARFPQPIVASPINTTTQSINSNLSLNGHNFSAGSVLNKISVADQPGADLAAQFTSAQASCLLSRCTYYVKAGNYTYSNDINITAPATVECDRAAVLRHTGTGNYMKLGPDGLTLATANPNPYEVSGCTFTGGATAAEGIYVNEFVIQALIHNNYFHNTCLTTPNATTFQIWLQGENWDSRIHDNYMWADSGTPCVYNGIAMNGADPANGTNGDFGQSQGVAFNNHIQNSSSHTVGTGFYVNGHFMTVEDNSIAGFMPNIQLGAFADQSRIIGNDMEQPFSGSSAPCISYGDSSGTRVGSYVDSPLIASNLCNVHNTDFSTTSHFMGPQTGTSGLQNAQVLNNRIASSNGGVLVVQNNLASQINNEARGNRINTSGAAFVPVTQAQTHSTGASISNWLGEDGDFQNINGFLQVNGIDALQRAGIFFAPVDLETDLAIGSGATIAQDHFVQIWDNNKAITAKFGCASATHGGRCQWNNGSNTGWQMDTGGNMFFPHFIVQYTGISTVANGIPAEFALVDLTAQSAAKTTTTLYAVPSTGAGQYRLSWDAKVTTVDAVSSTLGALTIVYTDPDGVAQTITAAAQITAGTIATTSTGNTTATVLIGLPLTLNCKQSTNITYAFAYVSNTPGQMLYNLHIRLEAI